MTWIVAGSVGVALCAGAAVWGQDARQTDGMHERYRILVVDEDGNGHEEVHEFDSDHPRPFLGIRSDEAPDGGAVVERVIEDTAAERAGLREGDVIVGIDGETIDGPRDLTLRLLRSRPGDVIDVEILRDGTPQTLRAELGEHPHAGHRFGYVFDGQGLEELRERLEQLDFDGIEMHEMLERLHEQLGELDFDFRFSTPHGHRIEWNSRPRLGVELVDVTPELREHLGAAGDEGVLVGKVLADMPAEEAGVLVGDLIVAVEGVRIDGPGRLRSELRANAGRAIALDVIRDGARLALTAYLPDEEPDADARFDRDAPVAPASDGLPLDRT
jgi:membrane-associated protease RseP (regulator of RpoE activity)